MKDYDQTDSRISILENDNRRHDTAIKEIQSKQTTMEICIACLPNVEKKLETINEKLEALNQCNILYAAEAKNKPVDFWNTVWGERLWDIIRAASLVIITLLFAINQHLLGAAK